MKKTPQTYVMKVLFVSMLYKIKPGCFQVGGHLCGKKYEAEVFGLSSSSV